jgi:hypothetical protein
LVTTASFTRVNQNALVGLMPTAEYMREYRKRPGVRERERREKRWYDLFHQDENRARWRRRNEERKAAKAEWYRRSAERIAKGRKTRRDYVAKFGRKPKGYIFTIDDMRKALDTGHDPAWLAEMRASWKRGAKDRAKRSAATRKQLRAQRALIAAYEERFGEFSGFFNDRLLRKSLKDGVDHLADRRAQDAASQEQSEPEHDANVAKFYDDISCEAERRAKAEGPFSAKTELAYTRLIKNRKLFEGSCQLRWAEYFEFRQANKCARLTANDRRYADQYSSCAVPQR